MPVTILNTDDDQSENVFHGNYAWQAQPIGTARIYHSQRPQRVAMCAKPSSWGVTTVDNGYIEIPCSTEEQDRGKTLPPAILSRRGSDPLDLPRPPNPPAATAAEEDLVSSDHPSYTPTCDPDGIVWSNQMSDFKSDI